MLDLNQFVADCRAALALDSSHKLVCDVVARAVSEPTGMLNGLGEPKRAGIQKLYHTPDLTILNVIWGPHMAMVPHNHRMWAVIGIYTGREDNIFWRASLEVRVAHWRRLARKRSARRMPSRSVATSSTPWSIRFRA